MRVPSLEGVSRGRRLENILKQSFELAREAARTEGQGRFVPHNIIVTSDKPQSLYLKFLQL
jgi:hypothetical protein